MCQLRPPFCAGDTRARATALATSQEEAQHASFTRVRAVPGGLWSVGQRRKEGHCTGSEPLFFGARPWCDVPAAASNAQRFRVAGARAPPFWLSLEEAQLDALEGLGRV